MPVFSEDPRHLRLLPKADRAALLEEIVLRGFKVCLAFEDADEIPMHDSYFELGMTSLQLTELKEEMALRFGCEIDVAFLFNNPTVHQFLEHLDELITRPGESRP